MSRYLLTRPSWHGMHGMHGTWEDVGGRGRRLGKSTQGQIPHAAVGKVLPTINSPFTEGEGGCRFDSGRVTIFEAFHIHLPCLASD